VIAHTVAEQTAVKIRPMNEKSPRREADGLSLGAIRDRSRLSGTGQD
jgi:hypothetical protein